MQFDSNATLKFGTFFSAHPVCISGIFDFFRAGLDPLISLCDTSSRLIGAKQQLS